MKRNLQLDFLRGVAILLVIGAHIHHAPAEGIVGYLGGLWNAYGGFGVPLFFALSGYLVGGLLLSELAKTGHISVGRFLMRRGLKIYPAYFVFLAYLIAMPVAKAWHSATGPIATATNLISVYFPNFIFVNNYVGSNPAGHTWSLAVEEHFYLTLPFVVWACAASKRPRLLLPICLLSPVLFTVIRLAAAYFGDPYIHSMPRTMAATHLWMDALFLGVGIRAVAQFLPEKFAALRQGRWWFILAGFIFLGLSAAPWPTIFGVPAWRVIPFNTLSGSCFLLGTIHLRRMDFGKLAAGVTPLAKILAWIGFYSYSIYLWHVTVMGIVQEKLWQKLSWNHSNAIIWLVESVVTICIVSLAGAVMSRIVEWPVLKFRDKYFPSRT